MKEETVICDASSLISLSDNCLLWLLGKLKANFVIPVGVKKEIFDNPIRSRRYELKALRLGSALDNGWISVLDLPGIRRQAGRIVDMANSSFQYRKRNVKILQEGEAETLALMLREKYKSLLIDERTTRLLVEDTETLKKYIEAKTRFRLRANRQVLNQLRNEFRGIKVIRSSELLAFAFERGLLNTYNRQNRALHAGLYGLKYSGCAITDEEIDQYLELFS
jgi:predicted nucleic acid-binding protein